VVLKIVAHRRRVDGSLSVNDRGTAYLGRTQARADLWLNGLERQGDQTRLTYAMPIDVNRFQYYGLAQSIALGAEGATATLSAGYIRTKPAYTAIEGSAETLSLQVSHPLWRGYQRSLYLTGALDGVDSTNTAYGQTLYSERVRTLRGAGAYSQQSAVSALTLSATLSQGLNTLGAQTLAPGWSDRSFFKANLAAKWSHGIGKQWVVRLDAVGQFSGDKLPGSEQFALGGDEFGRAFPATVATGDQGGAGSAELAFRPTKLPAPIKGSEVYGFIDGGQIHWQARPNDGYDARTQGLSSAGFGARLAVLSKGVLEVEVARALSNPLPGQDHGWRLTLSVRSLLE
jgi:hemolysin activation/secretion protein